MVQTSFMSLGNWRLSDHQEKLMIILTCTHEKKDDKIKLLKSFLKSLQNKYQAENRVKVVILYLTLLID